MTARRPGRRLATLAALVGLAGGLVLLGAAPASAHAVLESTDPPANARLETAPRAVTLTFNEPVEASIGAIRVLDANGNRVDRGRVEHPEGDSASLRVELREGLSGGFAVGYRVTSADSHPVQGAFTFGVGGSSGDEAAAVADELLAGEGGSRVVGALYAVVRWLLFGSMILLVGAAAFVRRLWPAGRGRRAVRRLLWAAWGILLGATVAGLGLQGAYAGGLPLTSAADPLILADVAGTRYGLLALARIGLLLVAIPVVMALCRPAPPAPPAPDREAGEAGEAGGHWFAGLLDDLVLLLGAGLLLTVALAGHAATGRLVPLAIVTDVAHLTAISIWLGGLAVLLVALLPRRDPGELGTVVPRFSSNAFACVAVIAASGAVQGWRQLGSFDALFGTTYGRLLLAKVAGVAVLVSLGAVSRRAVRRRLVPAALAVRPAGPGADRADQAGPVAAELRRVVAAEVAIGALVLALSALLVNAVPARAGGEVSFSTVAPDSPTSGQAGAQIQVGDQTVVVLVSPAQAGDNELHFSIVDRSGQLVPVAGFAADLRLPAQSLGPIELELFSLGPGHYAATGVQVPIKGTWKLTVKVRQSDIDEDVGVADIRIK